MLEGIIFAIIAAVAFGLWTVFHQLAANKINSLFGAIIVSLTAVIVGLIFLIPKIKTTNLYFKPEGIIFAILAGLCALAIDYFALKAYSTGLSVSIVGPIIIGGSIAIASIIGFIKGDSLSLLKIISILLIIIGSSILAAIA